MHAPSVRATCASLFLQFFLDYPLGDRRVREHLQLCVQNLEFDTEDGRAQALELLTHIVRKLPVAVLQEMHTLLLLPLATRLANEESSKCRKMVVECLRSLLQRLKDEDVDATIGECVGWFGSDNWKLRYCAALLLTSVVDARFARVARSMSEIAARVEHMLKRVEH